MKGIGRNAAQQKGRKFLLVSGEGDCEIEVGEWLQVGSKGGGYKRWGTI